MKGLFLLAEILLFVCPLMAAPVQFADAQDDLGFKGDGSKNITPALLAAFDEGNQSVYFPDGVYTMGTLELLSGVHLKFFPVSQNQGGF